MQTYFSASRGLLLFAAALAALAAGIASSVRAQEPETDADRPVAVDSDPVIKVTKETVNLSVVERFSKILELDARITAVDGFDPEVIDVTALTPNRVRVQAVAPGVTTVSLFDENQNSFTLEVFVTGDVRHLQAHLNKRFPNSAIEAVVVKDSVLLGGWVAQPEHIPQIQEIAEQFYPKVLQHMTVGGAQQVKLKVQVMEVQRGKIRQFGFNFGYSDGDGYFASTVGGLAQLTGVGPPLTFNPASLGESNIVGGVARNGSAFRGFLEALKQESLLKILAEPVLVTTNGRPANLLAGGEFPIQVPQSLGTTTIEWREFGVRMEAVPIILGNGRVRLELAPEVSEKDFTSSTEVNGFIVPALTSRRVNTQVEMNFGETFMLAGLLTMRKTAETDKVPVLGEIPWVGMAFRRIRYEEAETELVIMVTPELVGPLKECELPPGGPGLGTGVPTDRELYIDGQIEIPNYGEPCEGAAGCPGDGFVRPAHGTQPNCVPPHGTPPTEMHPHGAPMTAPGPPTQVIPPAPPETGGPMTSTQSMQYRQAAAAAAQSQKPTRLGKLAQGTRRLNPFSKAKPAGYVRQGTAPATPGAIQQTGYQQPAVAPGTTPQATAKIRLSSPPPSVGLIGP